MGGTWWWSGEVGPHESEKEKRTDATPLQNQCLFVRTLSFNLAEQILDPENLGVVQTLTSDDAALRLDHHPIASGGARASENLARYVGWCRSITPKRIPSFAASSGCKYWVDIDVFHFEVLPVVEEAEVEFQKMLSSHRRRSLMITAWSRYD